MTFESAVMVDKPKRGESGEERAWDSRKGVKIKTI